MPLHRRGHAHAVCVKNSGFTILPVGKRGSCEVPQNLFSGLAMFILPGFVLSKWQEKNGWRKKLVAANYLMKIEPILCAVFHDSGLAVAENGTGGRPARFAS